MADLSTANLIVSISPERYADTVPTSAAIYVQFQLDMNQSTFSDATIALEVVGSVQRVPCTYSYSNRVLTITPTAALLPGTAYQVTLVGDSDPAADIFTNHISGIRDITGNGMAGNFIWQFVTSSATTPPAPRILSPVGGIAISSQPTLYWTAVAGASGTVSYDVQVALDRDFESIFWPQGADTYDQTMTSVQPGRSLVINKEYWWRVRANVTGVLGAWSSSSNFYYGDPTLGTVTPDDSPIGVLNTVFPIQVVDANPKPATSNLSNYPTTISVKINGQINLNNLTANSMTITGDAVDGTWDPQAIVPQFSPSLNGSVWGSGGITYPGPEDKYQLIKVSGSLGATATGTFDGTYTTLSIPVSAGFFNDNNRYTITLDLVELPQPLSWTFTSRWTPVFASAYDVKQTTARFMPELLDDDIWYKIRRNSLYAIMIQVYVPTQIDGQAWIYRPPISFNVNNPPFFAREYVRLKSTLDFLEDKYFQLLTTPTTQLGDFTVNGQNNALRDNLQYAVQELKYQIKPFEDKLHGHTNRGYARGSWAGRGDYQFNGNPFRSWPFGTVRKGPNFNN